MLFIGDKELEFNFRARKSLWRTMKAHLSKHACKILQ